MSVEAQKLLTENSVYQLRKQNLDVWLVGSKDRQRNLYQRTARLQDNLLYGSTVSGHVVI